jgi:RNA polymerase sigma-70 factor (ECF subfamily)
VDLPGELAVPVRFEEFYRSEYAAVVRVAAGLTGRVDVAEELAQEAFLAAERHWQQVGVYSNPGAWVRRVVVNHALSALRRRAVEARLLARIRAERTTTVALAEPAEELWREVRRLPRRQAQVLALVFLEDRAVDDVATILGCDSGTVRTHLRRGRTTLASRLMLKEDQG